MLLSDIAITLEGMLNAAGDITFLVTDSAQNWFSWHIKDADGNVYAPVVIQAQPVPLMEDYYTTRRYTYIGRLKGLNKYRDDIEEIIQSAGTDKWMLDNFIVNDTNNREANNQFMATFRITIIAPTHIVGNDIVVKLDDEPVNVMRVSGIFDKMLLPNIPYGTGDNIVATGSEFTLTMPLDTTTAHVFAAMADNTYNRAYDLEIDFKAVAGRFMAVLTGGNFVTDINNNTVAYNARFIKAMDRGIIKIDDFDIPVISHTLTMSTQLETRRVDREIKVRGGNITNMHNLQLINDGSQVAINIINEIKQQSNRRFELKVHDEIISCVIVNGIISQGEHPNAVINVTMGVAWDE